MGLFLERVTVAEVGDMVVVDGVVMMEVVVYVVVISVGVEVDMLVVADNFGKEKRRRSW